jgi:hypothetical protein
VYVSGDYCLLCDLKRARLMRSRLSNSIRIGGSFFARGRISIAKIHSRLNIKLMKRVFIYLMFWGGCLSFLIALFLTFIAINGQPQTAAAAPHAAVPAVGFAVGGGLCFVAAAIAWRGNDDD